MKQIDRLLILFVALILLGCFLSDRLYFRRYIVGNTNTYIYRTDRITGNQKRIYRDSEIIEFSFMKKEIPFELPEIETSKFKTDDELFAFANLLQRKGKFGEAIFAYNRLLRTCPNSKYAPQAQFMVGFIYGNDFGIIDSAKVAFKQFIKDYPDHEMIKDAIWELEYLGE